MLLRRYHKPQPEIEAVAEDAEVAAPLEVTEVTEEAVEAEEAVAEDAEVAAPPKKSAGKKN